MWALGSSNATGGCVARCSLFSIDLHFITALIVVLLMYSTVSPYHQSHPPVEPVRPDDKGIKVAAERTLLYTDIM